MLRILVLCLTFVTSLLNAAEPLRLPEPLNQLQLIGKGQLRYFGFHVYDASTWSSSGQQLENGAPLIAPFALQIRYARDISAKDLIGKTGDAWRDLGLTSPQQAMWLQQLSRLWPNVSEGDVIVCYLNDDLSSSFYFNGVLRGTIADPAFGPQFLAIWLDSDAEFAELQRELSGRGRSE